MDKIKVDSIDIRCSIDDVITQLQKSKAKGATECIISVSHDKFSSYTFFETTRTLSDEDLKHIEIKKLEEKLNKLKS